MKKIFWGCTCCIVLLFTSSCTKDFLQLPLSNSTTVDSVFSTTTNALGAVANAYAQSLSQGLPYQGIWNSEINDNLSGALTYGFGWSISCGNFLSGMTASGTNEDMDGYGYNFVAIRQDYNVKENIDHVKNMSASDKAVIKAEMQALVAYRYEQMLIMYGGVPVLSGTLQIDDNLAVPRAPIQSVLDSITNWCDEAAAVLPSQWPSTYFGRMTKSAALAIKAKALLYAARPLFNSGTPYLDFGANNNLICFGQSDPTRWQTAATAAEAVISEAEGHGGLQIINTGNPLADYGTATSTPSNPEVILAYKNPNTWSMDGFFNLHNWYAYGNGLTTNYLKNYYKADGTEQTWPTVSTPFSDYLTRMQQMEPRLLADFWIFQTGAANNPGDNHWSTQSCFEWGVNVCAIPVKFYYKAGTRNWFEFPIFRLAAYYLSAAEAYNEMGETAQALSRLNTIHLRAGLPAITETDQTKLRAIIQREWATEFFDENYRLHDVKHWKLANIGNGIIGGPINGFTFNNNAGTTVVNNQNYQDATMYQGFWSPRQYLNPFPQSEVNKKVVIQNPGY